MPKRSVRLLQPRDYALGNWHARLFVPRDAESTAGPLCASVAVLIAQQILARRNEMGLSQEALAARAGISRNTVANIESGRSWPDFVTLVQVAEALELVIEITGWSAVTTVTEGTDAIDEVLDGYRSPSEEQTG